MKYGVLSVQLFFPALILMWVAFHLWNYNSGSSMYRDESGKIETWRVMIPVTRCLIQGVIQVVIALSFYFSGLSGVNGGIISSIFASAVVMIAIIFYFKHG